MAIVRKPGKSLNSTSTEENLSSSYGAKVPKGVKERPAALDDEKKGKISSPLTSGLRSLRSIQEKCLDIPSLIKPAIRKIGGSTAAKEKRSEPALRGKNRQPSPLPPAAPANVEADSPIVGLADFPGQTEEPILELTELVEQEPPCEEPRSCPVDQEKVGYVSPTYAISRSVTLNPQVMLANRCVGFQHASPELEFYKVLRTRIIQRSNGEGNTVMVTSALPGEGKTLTAINLAFTFAKEFKQTALLVDCDFKRQQVHKTLGYHSDKGLADYLLSGCPLQDLFAWPGVEKLTVISGGKTVAESSELLGSPGMKSLVTEMKSRYPERYIFFDVPPLLSSADPLAFAPLVDFIIVAVEAGRTPLPDVNRALSLLPGEKVLGLVMNRRHQVVKPYAEQAQAEKHTEG